MKTQVNKLDFKKSGLIELNDAQLEDVNGGSLLVSLVVVTLLIPAVAH